MGDVVEGDDDLVSGLQALRDTAVVGGMRNRTAMLADTFGQRRVEAFLESYLDAFDAYGDFSVLLLRFVSWATAEWSWTVDDHTASTWRSLLRSHAHVERSLELALAAAPNATTRALHDVVVGRAVRGDGATQAFLGALHATVADKPQGTVLYRFLKLWRADADARDAPARGAPGALFALLVFVDALLFFGGYVHYVCVLSVGLWHAWGMAPGNAAALVVFAAIFRDSFDDLAHRLVVVWSFVVLTAFCPLETAVAFVLFGLWLNGLYGARPRAAAVTLGLSAAAQLAGIPASNACLNVYGIVSTTIEFGDDASCACFFYGFVTIWWFFCGCSFETGS